MNNSIASLIGSALLLSFTTSPNAALLQAFHGAGNYGLDVTAVGFGGAPAVSSIPGNTLNLSGLPGGALPVQAYLYAYDTNHPGGVAATFNGQPLSGGAPVGPYASDAAFNTLYTFRWDVTNMIIGGVNNYSWSFTESADIYGNTGGNIGMAALAVVYSDPGLPNSTVSIYDGMTYVGNTHPETESLTITSLPAGSSTIYAATYQDDNFTPPGSTGETVKFNGNTIGGPLDGNLALNGSLTTMTAMSISGNNTMSITTPADEFGWTLAATITTPVPMPSAVWMFGIGLISLFGFGTSGVRGIKK